MLRRLQIVSATMAVMVLIDYFVVNKIKHGIWQTCAFLRDLHCRQLLSITMKNMVALGMR